jgi:hypothetical protein
MSHLSHRLMLAACTLLIPLGLLGALLSAAPAALANGSTPVPCNTSSLIAHLSAAVSAGGQQALDLAANCTYTLTAVDNGADVDTNGLPLITHTVNLTLNGNGASIVRDSGAVRFRLLEVGAGVSLTVANLTLAGGYTPDGTAPSQGNGGDGGAILNAGGTLTITRSTIRGNHTGGGGGCCSGVTSGRGGDGAGVYSEAGALTVISSTVAGNVAGNGGSAGNGIGGTGAGLSAIGSQVVVIDSTISGNVAGNGNPGGLLGSGGFGGGIAVISGTLSVSNSTLVGNATGNGFSGLSGLGGAILAQSQALTVTNSTIASNTVGTGGSAGAIAAIGISPYLKNDLLVGNAGGECVTTLGAGSTNNMSDESCGSEFTQRTAAQINLGPLADNGGTTLTRALQFPSAAIDAGTDVGCPATDQRGQPRPAGLHCDIGAYEFQAALHELFLPLVRR